MEASVDVLETQLHNLKNRIKESERDALSGIILLGSLAIKKFDQSAEHPALLSSMEAAVEAAELEQQGMSLDEAIDQMLKDGWLNRLTESVNNKEQQ